MEEALKEKLAKANAENKGVVVFPDYFRKKKDKINPELLKMLEATAKSDFTHADLFGVYKTGTFLYKNCIVTVMRNDGLWSLHIMVDNVPVGLPVIKEIRYKYIPDNVMMAKVFGSRDYNKGMKGVILYEIPTGENEEV